MPYRRVMLLMTVVPFLAACAEHPLTAPTSGAVADRSSAAARVTRPFGGRCETNFTPVPLRAGDPPMSVRLDIRYVCQLQHLGRVTGSADQIVTFTSPTTAVASNTTTYTAANGDQLHATWNGTSVGAGSLVEFSGPETYAGGTGRFVGVSGSTWISGTASLNLDFSGSGEFTSEGTLSF